MKIDTSELAPSGKTRLKIYLGDDELKIVFGALLASIRATPMLEETIGLRAQMKSMRVTLATHLGIPRDRMLPGKRTRQRRARQQNRAIALGEIWKIVSNPVDDPTGELSRIKGLMIGWDEPPPVAQKAEALS